jgi:RNA polymerase sigma factor (sigma-70 family)
MASVTTPSPLAVSLPPAARAATGASPRPDSPPPRPGGDGSVKPVDPDVALLEAWRQGDRAAGEALFGRYFEVLYRFFATKCADPGDLAQTTLLAVLRSRQQFAGRSSFRTYLFCIARNELYDHLRAHQRTRHFDPHLSSIAELVTTPASRLDRDHAHRRVSWALRALPVEQQTLLELHYWEELDAAALGEIFGAPPTTIRTRLRRARLALRERLLAAADDGEPLTPAELPPWLRAGSDD